MSEVPFSRKLGAWGVVAGTTAYIATLSIPGILDWFETHEKTSIQTKPPTGRVDRYAALVTGTASSDFDIAASADCAGVGGIDIENNWHAVATVANEIGSFSVEASADRSQVNITLDRYPELDSGLQIERTRTDSHEDSFLTACSGGDLVKLTANMMRTAQATADTIDECIVERPDFQQGLRDQLQAFGEAAYPGANVAVAPFPQSDAGPSESLTALEGLRAELKGKGININTGPVDNCEFEEFEMTPIVMTLGPGGTNG